jgi:hypothetical protein
MSSTLFSSDWPFGIDLPLKSIIIIKKRTRDDTRKTFRNTQKIKREKTLKQTLNTFHPYFGLVKTILYNKLITNSNKKKYQTQ